MIYGSMVHCLVLEPEKFDARYFTIDDTNIMLEIGGAKPRSTTRYKEWFATESLKAGERTVVDPDEYRHAKIVAMNVQHNRASAKVLNLITEREKPIEWEYKNFNFRGFIDGYGMKAVMDLKTCADAEPKKFQRDLINNGYYLQAAMYLYGLQMHKPYYIVAVDKVGGVSVHLLDEHLLEYGMKEYEMLCDKFNECILTDSFHKSYDFWAERFDGIFMATKTGWMFK